jgi:hypothetical protein
MKAKKLIPTPTMTSISGHFSSKNSKNIFFSLYPCGNRREPGRGASPYLTL